MFEPLLCCCCEGVGGPEPGLNSMASGFRLDLLSVI